MLERFRELLLAEMKEGKLGWYSVSTANDKEFTGGWLVRALGPTNAVHIIHTMGWFPMGSSTRTNGPIPGELVDKVPVALRWTKLNAEQFGSLGQ